MFTDILFLKRGFMKGKTEQFHVRFSAFKIPLLPNKTTKNMGYFQKLPLAQETKEGQTFTSKTKTRIQMSENPAFLVLIVMVLWIVSG